MFKAFGFALTVSTPAATSISQANHGMAMAILAAMVIGGGIYTMLRMRMATR